MKVVKSKKVFKYWINFLKIGIASALLVSFACFSGCFLTDENSSSFSGTSNNNKEKLNISNVTMSVDYNSYLGYSAKITGTAKNLSGKNYSYASIEYTIYDEEGNNLGTAIDNINHLANGDTWKFEANLFSYPSTRPTSYKLVDITAF